VRIEDRDGRPVLVDDAGLEVRRGDPLWVGLRVCFFDHAEPWPGVWPVMLRLRDQRDATAWERTIGATGDELGRLLRVSPCSPPRAGEGCRPSASHHPRAPFLATPGGA
jgi:hypothetical protein